MCELYHIVICYIRFTHIVSYSTDVTILHLRLGVRYFIKLYIHMRYTTYVLITITDISVKKKEERKATS